MDIFKATITLLGKSPATTTAVHERYFMRSEDAVQTFKNIILSREDGVSIIAKTEEVYDKRIAMKNGVMIAELRVLKLPLYAAARDAL
jgi:hypothetical protein